MQHYLFSSRLYYCGTCDLTFDSPLALKIHNEHATDHQDERSQDYVDIYVEERDQNGWEDRVAAERQRRENVETQVVVDERDALSRIEVGKAILKLKERMRRQQQQPESPSSSSKILKPWCAICLSRPKKICVTKCGHMFCSS